MNVDQIKADFPIFARHQMGGTALHYLDNAATAHKPKKVIDAISTCYEADYGPVSRGLYPLAEHATESYESAREKISGFVGAGGGEIIFTRSATESLNLVAEGALRNQLSAGDEVWVSVAEHHANYLPWLRICNATGATLRRLDVDENAKLVLPPLSELKSGRVKCVALSLISNVLGYYADIAAIVDQVKALGIITVVDAAQAVAHHSINVEALGCDFLAFSGHKMFGPTGIGVLYVSQSRINQLEPLLVGGGMVDWVGSTIEETEWTPGSAGFEAGSPNLAGAIGIAAAAEYIQQLDRDAVEAHLSELAISCGNALRELNGFITIGDESNWRAGIVTFTHQAIHPHDIAQVCGERGVAIRAGHHCAQPLMQAIGHAATARVSFSIYNNDRDVEALIMALIAAEGLFA